jgi:membrane-bound lytic murein transglycosylase C
MSQRMKRRQFLSQLAFLPLTVSATKLFADSFDDFVKSQQAGVERIKNDFQSYQERYLDAFQQYQRELEQEWQNVEISNQEAWVEYSKDLKQKTVVDYAANEIRLSYKTSATGDKKDLNTPDSLNQDLKSLLNRTEYQAINNDPITRLSNEQPSQNNSSQNRILLSELNEVYGSADIATKTLASAAVITSEGTSKGQVVTVIIPLPKKLPLKRAEKYYTSAVKAAKKWNIEAALVMAIAHTESHFNPLARSHIPAFGLMQIVPSSAGKDASKYMTGKSRLLTSTELYEPDFNLATGSAYLSMLQTRYLKGINDPRSRLYCAIAAYNTGSGNVAKAFIGHASMQRAFGVINQLSPERVFEILKSDLPYAETRRYLVKVMGHMESYQKALA